MDGFKADSMTDSIIWLNFEYHCGYSVLLTHLHEKQPGHRSPWEQMPEVLI